jgi:hypothetical protein
MTYISRKNLPAFAKFCGRWPWKPAISRYEAAFASPVMKDGKVAILPTLRKHGVGSKCAPGSRDYLAMLTWYDYTYGRPSRLGNGDDKANINCWYRSNILLERNIDAFNKQ